MFSVYGTATEDEPISDVEDRLRHKASARRRLSYERLWSYLTPDVLKAQKPSDMPETARRFAREVLASMEGKLDEVHEAHEVKVRIASLPKVRDLHAQAVAEDLRVGRISAGTAENAPYLAAGWLKLIGDRRLDKVTASDFSQWLSGAMGTGSKSALTNAVSEIRRVYKHLRRAENLEQYAAPFVTSKLSEALSGVVMTDGERRSEPLRPEEVELVIEACESDAERAAVALALLGIRRLGEVCAASWSDFSEELGSRWFRVSQAAVDLSNGRVVLEAPKDVKKRKRSNSITYRHYPVTARLWSLIEPLSGQSEFVLGAVEGLQTDTESGVPNPVRLSKRILGAVLTRAGITRPRVTPYSFRHTVLDATEEHAGRIHRDLLHRGDDDNSVANRHYTHADATRFRKRLLMPDGKTCGDVLPWAREP